LIKEEINKCYNEKQDILNSIDSYKKSYSKESNINKKDLKRFLSNFKTIFDNASKEQRRELIRTFVRYIEFNPVKVEITVEFYDESTLQSIRYCEPYHK
jgi:DNA phosphorothioation-dependent restriction protein DptG